MEDGELTLPMDVDSKFDYTGCSGHMVTAERQSFYKEHVH